MVPITSNAIRQFTPVKFEENQGTNQRIINETFIRNAFDMNGVKFASLPISQMCIDEDYQRPPQRKIRKIANEWDIANCRTLEVSYRDNKFYVVDGQNRFLAAQMVGEECVPCLIHTGLTKEEEARIFSSQDDNKTKVSTVDKFNADITAQNPDAIKIKEICDEFDIAIGRKNDTLTGCVRSLNKLKSMWKSGKDTELRWIFTVIKDAEWHTVKNGYCDDILSALHQVYICNRYNLDEAKSIVVDLLSQTSPDMVMARAKIAYLDYGRRGALCAYINKYLAQHREESTLDL